MLRTVLLLFLLLALRAPGFGCTCATNEFIESNWKHADQVFLGVVIRADTSGNVRTRSGTAANLYTIRIIESYKDTVFRLFDYDLRTFLVKQGGGSCDYADFKLGGQYIVFGYEFLDSQFLLTSQCGRTGELHTFTSAEIQELRALNTKSRQQNHPKKSRIRALKTAKTFDSPHLQLIQALNDDLRTKLRFYKWLSGGLGGLAGLLIGLVFWRKFK